MVSHDRGFLNAFVTDIVHLHLKTLKYYPGDFDSFEKARANQLQKMQHIEESLERQP